jgi:NAD(P)-dependent dehydrogenase (short-subunit alcohol dehydrogenase family)
MDRLNGKVAVITGGCSGIGRAAVERFVEEGARVVLADIQEAAGEEIARAYPGKVRFQRCDVTREFDIAAAMQAALDGWGGLDVVFNNAGAVGARVH